jgi:nucleotide-binding universal stress UspA family protein
MGDIIVGVDGSDGSRAALRWAARTAAARGAGLRAVTAWQYPANAVTPAAPARLPGPEEMDERTCDEGRVVVLEELAADADLAEVEAGRGPAASVLLTAAARPGTDMLVVGARGLGGFAGLLLGSVSQECVEHSPCPVVVLRDDPEPMDGPIVIGLDGSEGSIRALEWSIDLAEATGLPIVAVHAPMLGANNAMMDAAREALEQWCAPIGARAVPHEIRIEPGDARTSLEHVADETGASLLVVGTRGLGAVRGLLLGSVAGYVARYSTRPIAVVPRSTG